MTEQQNHTKNTENAFTALNQKQLKELQTETSKQINERLEKIASEQPNRRITCYCALELNWYKTVGALDRTTFIEWHFPISRQEVYKEKRRASTELVIFDGDFSKVGSIKASDLDLLHKEAEDTFSHTLDKHAFYKGVWANVLEHKKVGKRRTQTVNFLTCIKKYLLDEKNIGSKLTGSEQKKYIEANASAPQSSASDAESPVSSKGGASMPKEGKTKAKVISNSQKDKPIGTPGQNTKGKYNEVDKLKIFEQIEKLSNQVSNKDKIFWVQKWVSDLLLSGTALHIILAKYQKSTSSGKFKKQLKRSIREACHR